MKFYSKHIFAIFFFFSFCFISCENELAEIQRVFQQEEMTREVMKEVEILYSDSAVVNVRIISPTLIRFTNKQDPKQEFPDGLIVDFLSPNGKISSKLTAKYGMRYENQNQIVVRDSVIWESVSKERLETEELTWDEQKEKLYTNKYVTIIRPEEIIFGYGFEANQNFTYSKIKAIEGTIKVNDLTKELQ